MAPLTPRIFGACLLLKEPEMIALQVWPRLVVAAACAAIRLVAMPGLAGDEPWLRTFVGREEIEPTNNTAERAGRHAVLWRKSSGGTNSETGSRFVERILGVVATCRQPA
jgi:transposase